MSHSVRLYILMLLAIVIGWFWWRAPVITVVGKSAEWPGLLAVAVLYLCAHLLRMLRLALLTLDERNKVFHLMAAHTLTAFPSSFLPLKLGEVLRLMAFFHVYDGRRKALAVWLAERFGDVLVIAGFILSLYVFNISVPDAMRAIFFLFVTVSVFGLLTLFAVAKVFVYLNRHLVLSSHTSRGLLILRASYILRRLELDIYKSVEGRLTGFFLLSALIWALEILSLSLFINQFSNYGLDFSAMFVSGLLASLQGAAGDGPNTFALYQSLTLVFLSLLFLAVVWLVSRLGIVKFK